jgi:hypothetical protein
MNRGSPNSAHIHGTDVPVEEPSTASTPEVASIYSISLQHISRLTARPADSAVRKTAMEIVAKLRCKISGQVRVLRDIVVARGEIECVTGLIGAEYGIIVARPERRFVPFAIKEIKIDRICP